VHSVGRLHPEDEGTYDAALLAVVTNDAALLAVITNEAALLAVVTNDAAVLAVNSLLSPNPVCRHLPL